MSPTSALLALGFAATVSGIVAVLASTVLINRMYAKTNKGIRARKRSLKDKCTIVGMEDPFVISWGCLFGGVSSMVIALLIGW